METLLALFKPPKPLIFDHNAKLNLEVFLNHLDVYLKVTGLNPQDDVIKIAVFLSHAGEEARNKFYSFKLTDVQAKQYETIIEAFKEYCKPFKSETQERFKFFKRVQHKEEDFDHFLTAVKCLAKECNFGELEESLIRDKIVSSVLDPSLQEELLRIPNLTLEIAENHCRTSESSRCQLKEPAIRSVIKIEADDDFQEGGTNEKLQVANLQSDNVTKQTAGSSNFGFEINTEEIKMEEFTIDVKGETFESPLDEPIRTYVEKRFVCATCDIRFARKRSLIVHMKTHAEEKPYKCNFCSFKFKYSETLKRHLRTHPESKTFPCKICGYKCSQKVKMRLHVKRHAKHKQKPFTCNTCGYRCWKKELLNIHLKAHAFSSDICEYKCSQKRYLQLHKKNDIGEKSNSCEFCKAKLELEKNQRLQLTTAGKKSKKKKKSKKRNVEIIPNK